jgi:hypothetical protein
MRITVLFLNYLRFKKVILTYSVCRIYKNSPFMNKPFLPAHCGIINQLFDLAQDDGEFD